MENKQKIFWAKKVILNYHHHNGFVKSQENTHSNVVPIILQLLVLHRLVYQSALHLVCVVMVKQDPPTSGISCQSTKR